MNRPALAIAFPLTLAAAGARGGDEGPSPLTIEGYTDRLSYRAGESVAFHVSTTAAKYSMEIGRLGAEAKVVLAKANLPGSAHPIPEDASSMGCRWPVSHRVEVPAGWKSGYYNVRLRVADEGGKYVGRGHRTAEVDLSFIVLPADPGRDASILLELATDNCTIPA